MVSILILNGCSQPEAASTPVTTAKVSYLWTVISAQGEAVLDKGANLTPGQSIALHVAADSQPAKVVVAAFEDNALSFRPPPTVVTVPSGGEQTVRWQAPQPGDSPKVFSAFIPADGASSREIEQLVAQCAAQKDGRGPAAQRLYDRLTEWAGQDRGGSKSSGAQVLELGATLATFSMSPETEKKSEEADQSQTPGKSAWRAHAPV